MAVTGTLVMWLFDNFGSSIPVLAYLFISDLKKRSTIVRISRKVDGIDAQDVKDELRILF
jgi:hypothetical protein